MEVQISRGLRITFFIHFIVAVIFGFGFVFVPGLVGTLYGVEASPPVSDIYRVLGAALVGWGFSSWIACKAENWESIRILIMAEIVWTGLGALVMLYTLLFNAFPPLGWLNCAMFAAFSAAFAFFFWRAKR